MKTMPTRRNLVPIGNSDRNASKKILFLRNIPKAENTPATPGRKTPYWGARHSRFVLADYARGATPWHEAERKAGAKRTKA